MQCEEARECISRQLDFELPGERRAELEQHMKSCEACARFAEESRKLHDAMRAAPTPVAAEGYWNGLLARMTQSATTQANRQQRRLTVFRTLWYVAAAASLLLIVGVVAQQGSIASLRGQVAQLNAVPPPSPAGAFDPFSAPCPAPTVSTAALKEQEAVFGDLSHYFQGGLKWIVEDGSQTDMGVSEEAPAQGAAQENRPMIAQFQLVRFEGGGKSEVISAPTLTMLPGAEARFDLETTRGARTMRLPYRCVLSQPAGGAATLSVSLDLNPPLENGSANLSGVAELHPGSCQPVAFTRAGNVGYALFVALLPQTEKAGT